MIRDGYESLLDPDLDRRCRADELASCGVLLPGLLKTDDEEDAGSEPVTTAAPVAP